jgi:hypothetical protein
MKVGKAIYNILSQSTDVQSNFPFNTTDYAPTGTELVTNGDFAEIGSDQVLNGDFATDLANWNNKSATSTWVSGSAVVDNSIGNLSSGLYQDIGLVSGKSYKLTATLKLNSGDSNGAFRVFTSTIYGSNQSSIFTGDTLIIGGASVTETFYFTHSGTNVSIQFACDAANAIFEVDNVSCEELGEGWVVQTGWSIGEDKAICDGSTNNYVRQSLSLPVGNIKVTFKVEDFTSGTLKLWINLPAFTTIVTATAADTYEAYITTTSGANNLYFYSVAFVGSIN